MKLNKLVSVLACIAMLAVMLFGACALAEDTIKIGAMYALSGDKAAIGNNILRGIDFAVEEINAAGGVNGKMIEIVRGDTQGDAKVAGSLA